MGRPTMTVHDLARRAGVPAHVVRYYSQRGLLSPARDQRNAYRQYSDADLARLRFVCRARDLGFTLHEINQILVAAEGRVGMPSGRLRELICSRWTKNERRLADALRLQERAAGVVEKLRLAPGDPPDAADLRLFVEAIALED
jgi:DNA-binding transcriptional MerR regulator